MCITVFYAGRHIPALEHRQEGLSVTVHVSNQANAQRKNIYLPNKLNLYSTKHKHGPRRRALLVGREGGRGADRYLNAFIRVCRERV